MSRFTKCQGINTTNITWMMQRSPHILILTVTSSLLVEACWLLTFDEIFVFFSFVVNGGKTFNLVIIHIFYPWRQIKLWWLSENKTERKCDWFTKINDNNDIVYQTVFEHYLDMCCCVFKSCTHWCECPSCLQPLVKIFSRIHAQGICSWENKDKHIITLPGSPQILNKS